MHHLMTQNKWQTRKQSYARHASFSAILEMIGSTFLPKRYEPQKRARIRFLDFLM